MNPMVTGEPEEVEPERWGHLCEVYFMETKLLRAFDILRFSGHAAMMIFLRCHLESKLEAKAPKIPKPRPEQTPRNS
jgi:hypothetical protein